jgi:hypothetical protein
MTNGNNGNIVGPDPNLGPLTGSPGFFPLLTGSLAIDTGSDTQCAAVPVSNTSQNGLARPQGAHCDIGAFERDVTPPVVLSSVRASANPSKAASVSFTVTFSEAVSGVDLTDFSLTVTGVTGASVGGVNGSGATRTVVVNTGSGSGTIRLDVLDNDSIVDGTGNPLNSAFNSGQSYTIDRVAPIVTSTVCINSGPTPSPSTIFFNVSFVEAVTGVDVADFTLVTTGVSGASISAVQGSSGGARIVVVNSGSGNGTLRLDLPAGATITDLAGNPLSGLPFTLGATCIIDKTLTLSFDSLAANDGFVTESAETSGVGGSINSAATIFNLGDDASNREFRAILHFDTSNVPVNATLLSATLTITQQNLIGTDPFTTHGALRAEIRNPFFGAAAALQANDFQAAPNAVAAAFNPTPVAGVYSANLNAAGLANINRLGSTQFRLHFITDDNNDLQADFMRFFSGETATATRPKLIIRYVLQ